MGKDIKNGRWLLRFHRDDAALMIAGNDETELEKVKRAMGDPNGGWRDEPNVPNEPDDPWDIGGEEWRWAIRGPKKKLSLRPTCKLKPKEEPGAKEQAIAWMNGQGKKLNFNSEATFAVIQGNRSSGQWTRICGAGISPFCRIATNDNTIITKIRNLVGQNPMTEKNPLGWGAVRMTNVKPKDAKPDDPLDPKNDYVVAYCPKGCIGFRS
jgi:hypothetical protein